MNSNKPKSFLGTGWDFPPTFDKPNRRVKMVSDEADIQSSLEILVSTALGERVMRPDYGSNLDNVIFEPMDLSLQSYVEQLIKEAIYLHEPRITPEKVELETDPEGGEMMINIEYIISATNTRRNVVYPYYLLEGTNIE